MTKASAVENTDRPSSARIDAIEGVSVHGWSTIRLSGTSMTAPQSIEPAAGNVGSRPLKPRPKIAAPA